MTVVRRADTRRAETPNATMTTYASPSLGGSAQALWQVEMPPAAAGPLHTMDGEQVWTVRSGAARVDLGGATHAIGAGEAIVLPAGVCRRIHADPDAGLVALVTGPGAARDRARRRADRPTLAGLTPDRRARPSVGNGATSSPPPRPSRSR